MKFSIDRNDLMRVLIDIAPAIPKSGSLPVLSQVRITENEIVATDLDTTIQSFINMEIDDDEKPEVLLPYRQLSEIVKELDGTIAFDVPGTHCMMKAGKSKYKLLIYPIDEFPRMPYDDFILLDELHDGTLGRLITNTAYCMGTQTDIRFNLEVARIEVKNGKMHMVCTDSHRLAFDSCNCDGTSEFLISAKAIGAIRKLIGRVQLSVGGNHVRFHTDNKTITCRTVEGLFPQWRNVVPASFERTFTADRKSLIKAIRKVGVVGKEDKKAIIFMFKPDCAVLHSFNDSSEATDEIAGVLTGGELTIAFTTEYIRQAIETASEDAVVLQMNEAMSPAIIQDNNCTAIVMPVRI